MLKRYRPGASNLQIEKNIAGPSTSGSVPNENNCSDQSHNNIFKDLLPTPVIKAPTNRRRKALNSKAQVVVKSLFDQQLNKNKSLPKQKQTTWIKWIKRRLLKVQMNLEKNNGLRQSPININTLGLIYSWAPSLKWSYGYALTPKYTYINKTGNSISLSVEHKSPLEVSSGILDVPYKFDQLHFHWGEHNGIGSEHKINGYTYPLEMHVVHSQNSKNDIDQILVIAYFFKISSEPNPGLQSLLDKILEAGDKDQTKIKSFALGQLLPAKFSYFTYKGSLTTPPYTESVTWIISTTELPISESQLNVFRETAKKHDSLKNNFRCLQDSTYRYVRYIPDNFD
ncbi:hypothetical protein FQR65_LT08982 [Abscondita terminalis]|nr:hypothetical protein FQR65_LT08982 [Abscondita terminalis]